MTILVVGDANADLTATLIRFPHEGDDSTVTSLIWGGGGSAANTAVALARLNAPTRLLSRVGTDPVAEVALRAAREAGVDLSLIQIDRQHATGLCYAAISPGGERTFFAFRGANLVLEPGDMEANLAGVYWLHLSGHALIGGVQRETTMALIRAASDRDIPISLDTCLPLLRAHRDETLALLPGLAILFANEIELCQLATGIDEHSSDPRRLTELAVMLKQHGAGLVVAKCGTLGCIITDGRTAHHISGFHVHAIDTNGCGDAFAAGFLAARLAGAAPNDCALVGNVCGALAATRPGAAESLPNRADVLTFLRQYPECPATLQGIFGDHEQRRGI